MRASQQSRCHWAFAACLLIACDGKLSPAQKAVLLVPADASLDPVLGPDGRYVCSDKIYPAENDGRRITLAEYTNIITDVFGGLVPPSAQFPGSYGTSVTGFSTEPGINEVGAEDVEQIELAAEDTASSVAQVLPELLACTTTTADDSCANNYIDTYIRRAYRHSISDDERAPLMSTFDAAVADGASFSDAIAMLTDHALQTPQFLYLMEGAAPQTRQLTGDEVATRLSFMLWDSIPDDSLLAAADSGLLSSPGGVQAEASRLLANLRSTAPLVRFFREWTGTLQVSPAMKDPLTFPNFSDDLASSINTSFDEFVTDQMRNQGTLHSLLRSPNVFVDANMAAFFGVAPPAAGWSSAALDATQFSGLVTQPALMASLATASDALYQRRGKFVIEQLMCNQLGNPPADAQSVFAGLALPANPTGKDDSAMVNAQPACTGCHAVLDPPGLAFENFDGLGHYRSTYASGKAIDASGTMQISTGSIHFADQTQMMEQLADAPEVSACFAKQIFRFTMSREETPEDACAIQAIGDALTQNNGNLAAAFLSMTQTQAFLYRRDAQ